MVGYGWYQWQPPSFSRGRFSWVRCEEGRLPYGATPAGRDGDSETLYAGRAYYEDDLLPGKVRASHHGAYVPWRGGEHMCHKYEVLVSNDVAWKPCEGKHIPPQALIVGHTSNGEDLYLGRAWHDGTITPGKVQRSHGCLYIPYNGQEVKIKTFEILVLL